MSAAAIAAGAPPLQTPQPASFGRYLAHIADSIEGIWEICLEQGRIVEDDGTVRLV
uniref:hypothetical protein n=1 Tax=unclassified Rhodococcus (in: high G+C Gram-positive bacteria) TaxID=192944 RepID=UPI00159547B5|nr:MULTISPECIES: hypothetical protein [unclassified Rhodococcus (in: high G+C Gram-positive bacteria)]